MQYKWACASKAVLNLVSSVESAESVNSTERDDCNSKNNQLQMGNSNVVKLSNFRDSVRWKTNDILVSEKWDNVIPLFTKKTLFK